MSSKSVASRVVTVDYPTAVKQAMYCFESGVTPMFEGHSGIGKSALATAIEEEAARLFAETKGAYGYEKVETVIIFGSLLKEGELGGIPESVEAKHLGKDMMDETIRVNRYTIYEKIHDVLRLSQQVGPNGRVLLFVDELNRTDQATQGELMQLVLDRRVQNIILPDNVYIMAAINPDDLSSDGLDYGVTTMNEALVPRFALYSLKVDAGAWLKWAARVRSGMHPDVVEFIADNTDMLHQPKAEGRMKLMPRSWQHFSKLYTTITNMRHLDNKTMMQDVYIAAAAKLGDVAAKAFTEFLKNRSNPLIKPEDLLKVGSVKGNEEQDAALLKKLSNEPGPRLMITLTNVLKFLDRNTEKGWNAHYPVALCMALESVKNVDAVYTCIHELGKEFPATKTKVCKDKDFVKFFASRLTAASRV